MTGHSYGQFRLTISEGNIELLPLDLHISSHYTDYVILINTLLLHTLDNTYTHVYTHLQTMYIANYTGVCVCVFVSRSAYVLLPSVRMPSEGIYCSWVCLCVCVCVCVCVSVCYSTSHFSGVCSSHKGYDLLNRQ